MSAGNPTNGNENGKDNEDNSEFLKYVLKTFLSFM